MLCTTLLSTLDSPPTLWHAPAGTYSKPISEQEAEQDNSRSVHVYACIYRIGRVYLCTCSVCLRVCACGVCVFVCVRVRVLFSLLPSLLLSHTNTNTRHELEASKSVPPDRTESPYEESARRSGVSVRPDQMISRASSTSTDVKKPMAPPVTTPPLSLIWDFVRMLTRRLSQESQEESSRPSHDYGAVPESSRGDVYIPSRGSLLVDDGQVHLSQRASFTQTQIGSAPTQTDLHDFAAIVFDA